MHLYWLSQFFGTVIGEQVIENGDLGGIIQERQNGRGAVRRNAVLTNRLLREQKEKMKTGFLKVYLFPS